jgi:hypothetical protein
MSAEPIRTSNQSRASTKIAIVFAIIVLGAYFGYKAWSANSVAGMNFPPVTPTDVNLVGLDTSRGYYIVVANGIAQVIEGEVGKFEAPAEAQEGDKKRIPIKEMLQAMQGNPEATSRFVMAMNEMKDEDLPVTRVNWELADLRKALAGDAALLKKLESDLNTKMDGTPLPEGLRPSRLDTGIVINAPVKVTVPANEGDKEVDGTLLIPFQSRFMIDVWTEIANKPDVTNAMMAGYYAEVGNKLLNEPNRRQNVAKALTDLTSDAVLEKKVSHAEGVMDSLEVLINGTHIEEATYEGYDTPRGKMYDIKLKLTDEGRNRLWKYSQGRVGSQILLTVDGVALAAPKIGHDLAQRDLTIRQILLDERYIRDAVDKINQEGRKSQ